MSMPRPRALTPLALEMMTGRFPWAGASACAPVLAGDAIVVRAKRLVTLATALPASEVRKNLRRDHRLMGPPDECRGNIQQRRLEVGGRKFDWAARCYRSWSGLRCESGRQARPPHSKGLGEEEAFGGAG